MPVVDQKPIGKDCDDDHQTKLVERQRKNDNDTSPVFSNIPIGPAVAVQHEDSSPWTHGMVVGKGNHNHLIDHMLSNSQTMADAFQETDNT